MLRLFMVIAMLASVTALTVPATGAAANEHQPSGISLLLIDSTTGRASNQEDLAVSVASLYTSLSQDVPHAVSFFANSTTPAVMVERATVSNVVLDNLRMERETSFMGPPDTLESLFLASEYLSDGSAPSGSRVLIVSSGSTREELATDTTSVIDRFTRNGWIVDVAFLAEYETSLLTNAAEATGGKMYDLYIPRVFEDLITDTSLISSDSSRYAQVDNEVGASVSFTVNVPPETGSVRFVLHHRPSANSSIEIVSPSGVTVPAQQILNTPHITIYSSPSDTPPESGQWQIDYTNLVTGLVGLVAEVNNPIEVVLSNRTLPLELNDVVLQAQTIINDTPVTIPGINILVSIRQTNSLAASYSLTDEGENGDMAADDGIYSSLIAPLDEVGIAEATIQFGWPEQGTRFELAPVEIPVVNTPSFDTSSFRELRINPIGEWLLAEIVVTRAGEPFYIDEGDISVLLKGTMDDFVPVIRPTDEGAGGYAKFNVWGALEQTDDYVVDVTYNYTFSRETQFSINVVSDVQRITVSNLPPSFGARPSWLFGIPLWVAPVAGISFILLVSLAVWLLRKPSPHGFLYDEDGNLLDDLSKQPHGFFKRLFSRSAVSSDKLNLGLLGNLEIRFDRDKNLYLYYIESEDITTLRIDGKPCLPRTATLLRDGSLIGIRGRLIRVRYDTKSDASKINQDVTDFG